MADGDASTCRSDLAGYTFYATVSRSARAGGRSFAGDAVAGFATLVWPPTGISIAGLLLIGNRLWPGILLGAFVANMLAGASVAMALGITVGNTAEALACVHLVRRARGFSVTLENVHSATWMILAVGLGTIVSATIGVASLYGGGVIEGAQVHETWRGGGLATFVPEDRLRQECEDANELISNIMLGIHPRAYAFVVADITAPKQLPWDSVARLKARGHESVDLYMLFPLHMGLNRMLPRDRDGIEPNVATLDAFFGTDEWRVIWEAQRSRHEMRRGILEFYMERLRTHGAWKHVSEVRDVRRGGTVPLYRMLYATDSDVGAKISDWLVDHFVDHTGQGDIFSGQG